jgi:hypothetical protein
MKITTNRSITSEEWKAQAERFSLITDRVNKLTFPKTGVTNLHAEIQVEILQPLSKGFKAQVKYIQHFEKPVGETTTDAQHTVVDYYERIPRDMVNVMISQFTDNIPSELTAYLDIQDWIIQQGVLQQIVSKQTFGGLTANDYTIE